MTRFHFRAVSGEGEKIEGEIEARDRSAVVEQLRRRRQMPLAIRVAGEGGLEARGGKGLLDWLNRPLWQQNRLKPGELAIMTREVATLLGAGLTVDNTLKFLAEVAPDKAQRRMFSGLLESVQGGSTLADALDKTDGGFSSVYVNLVRAGEAGNALGQVLGRLADFLERSEALRQRVNSALVYPLLLLFMAGVSIGVLLVVVLPQFAPMFENAGAELPLITRVVVSVGKLAQNYWWLALILLTLSGLWLNNRLKNPESRAGIDRLLLKLPLIGDLVVKIDTARLSRTLGTLIANGVPLPNALAIARGALDNGVLRDAVGSTLAAVKEGRGLAQPMERAGVFPPLAVQMIAVGERAGHLETMLLKVADMFDQEVTHSVDRLMTLLVPMLTIGIGLVIATIIGAILSAILAAYQLPI